MRKISKSIANAFKNGERRCISNTVTDNNEVLLHGNRIMWKNDSGDLCLSMCGWDTPTTRERLNALLYVLGSEDSLVQRDGEQWVIGDTGIRRLIDPNEVYTLRPNFYIEDDGKAVFDEHLRVWTG